MGSRIRKIIMKLFVEFLILFSVAFASAAGAAIIETHGSEMVKPNHKFGNWSGWEQWDPPAELEAWFPYFKSGVDRDRRPVYVIDLGKWNFNKLTSSSSQMKEAFWKFYEQLYMRALQDSKEHSGACFIVDMSGFRSRVFSSPEGLEMALEVLQDFVQFNRIIKYGFFINMNYNAELLMNVAKLYWGPFANNFSFFSEKKEKWRPILLKRISADQLPPHLGGAKAWRPSRFITSA